MSPMGKLRTSPEHVLAVGCPLSLCTAEAGEPCVDQRQQPRLEFHAERHEIAVAQGAPTTDELRRLAAQPAD